MTELSLFERLGGANAIAMVVDGFSDEIVKNPKLNVNPQLKEWNTTGQLPGLKFMRTLWSGKRPADTSSTQARTCMKHTRISTSTSEEFDEVDFNVPEREKGEVLAAIVASKAEVVNP
jgi:hemoglobin